MLGSAAAAQEGTARGGPMTPGRRVSVTRAAWREATAVQTLTHSVSEVKLPLAKCVVNNYVEFTISSPLYINFPTCIAF